MTRQKAYSLIELMVTVSVLSIFLVFIVPSVNNLISNNQALAISDELALSLRLAKTEAIKLNTSVSLCSASSSAQDTCGSNTSFPFGWIVFKDDSESGTFSNTSDIIKVSPLPKSHVTLTSTLTSFTFNSMGYLTSNTTDITVSPTHCASTKRQISLSSIGRVKVLETNC